MGMPRREFLRRGGAALAVPWVVPASALGKDGFTAPSERIQMGFIGLGGQGSGHLLGGAWTYLSGGCVARDEVQVTAVCDVIRDRRDGSARRVDQYYAGKFGQVGYQACRAFIDFRELLARSDVDAVVIGTPIHWHAPMSILAAEAGKDVYCEKPTALTIRSSRRVADAVRRYGRVYQGGTQQRSEYGGKFRLACELVRSGRLGTLQEVWAFCAGGCYTWSPAGPPQPVPDWLDWDLWLGPAPWFPFDGRLDSHRFGSDGINWGQHHYDIVQWALDADRSGPVELDFRDGHAVATYASGVQVHGAPWPGQSVGDTGGAVFRGTAGWLAVDREELISDPPELVREPLRAGEVHLPATNSHMGEFLECIRTRRQPVGHAEATHRAASALILGGLVQQLRRKLRWDPATERFVDDAAANRLLEAASRAPWDA
ncbi:MAG: Gfo/Idh/MocA family oxidoreductase [Fimbriimonadaceae bacterium]|nr:Gfo/Idh/MocA family oxidoreductase [Fimbriimonadaceae bacterium]